MKFFKSIFYIFIISALFSSCIMDDGAIDVELKNETDKKIEFVYFWLNPKFCVIFGF